MEYVAVWQLIHSMQDKLFIYTSSGASCRAGGASTISSNSLSSAQQPDAPLYISFDCNVSFALNPSINDKCHSLWELTELVHFPAMSGTVVAFVACIRILFDRKKCAAFDE